MPAESKAQQRLMGMALAAKRGKGEFGGKIKEIADNMSEKQLRDFAKTKHEGLAEKKASTYDYSKPVRDFGHPVANTAAELLFGKNLIPDRLEGEDMVDAFRRKNNTLKFRENASANFANNPMVKHIGAGNAKLLGKADSLLGGKISDLVSPLIGGNPYKASKDIQSMFDNPAAMSAFSGGKHSAQGVMKALEKNFYKHGSLFSEIKRRLNKSSEEKAPGNYINQSLGELPGTLAPKSMTDSPIEQIKQTGDTSMKTEQFAGTTPDQKPVNNPSRSAGKGVPRQVHKATFSKIPMNTLPSPMSKMSQDTAAPQTPNITPATTQGHGAAPKHMGSVEQAPRVQPFSNPEIASEAAAINANPSGKPIGAVVDNQENTAHRKLKTGPSAAGAPNIQPPNPQRITGPRHLAGGTATANPYTAVGNMAGALGRRRTNALNAVTDLEAGDVGAAAINAATLLKNPKINMVGRAIEAGKRFMGGDTTGGLLEAAGGVIPIVPDAINAVRDLSDDINAKTERNMQFNQRNREVRGSLQARNTGIADADGEIYVNGSDVELLGKLGFEYSESDYDGLEKTSEVLDVYSYIEKVAGVPKEVAKLIDAGQAFSGEYLKDMGYSVPKGYEVKGDLVCPIEKKASKERVRVVLPYENQYLLEKLMNPKWPDNYGKRRFPGGGIDGSETPAQAASREFMEELGINASPDKFEYMGLDPTSGNHYLKLMEHGLAPGKYKASVGSDPYIYLEQGLPEGLDYLGADISKFAPVEKTEQSFQQTGKEEKESSEKTANTQTEAEAWHQRDKKYVTIHVPTLISRVKGRQAQEMNISSIKGGTKTSPGYSDSRLKGTNVKYPIIVDSKNELVDGRHRKIKLLDAGKTKAQVIRINDDDIDACSLHKTANTQHKLEAVVIKGNPKYLNNPHADKFYQNVADHLKGHGYNVSFDNGEPYTSPKAADLWVGHSRGADRLRFAPKHTKTIALGGVGGITHSKDKALSKDGPIPDKWHFTLSADMKSKINNVIGKTKTAATSPGMWTTPTGSWHRSENSLVNPEGRVMNNTPNSQPMVESPYLDIAGDVALNTAETLAQRLAKKLNPLNKNKLNIGLGNGYLANKYLTRASKAVPLIGATLGASEVHNRWQQEDTTGAAIKGLGVAGDIAQMSPDPRAKVIGLGASWGSTAANAARDINRYNNRPVEFRNTPPTISQPSAPQATPIQQPLQSLAKQSSADPAQTILITGHSGSGKTTLSRQLAEKLGIPVRRVDAHRGWDNYIRGDDKHWKETLTPGTKEHSYFTDLVNRATRDTLKNAPAAGIIEGTQLGHLSPEELAKFKAHIVAGGTRDQSIAQRIQRSVDKASKQGITFSPEEMAAKKIKAEYVANFWEPGVEKFRKLPGVLNYNHSEHQIDPLVEQLKHLMGKQASEKPGLWANIRAKRARGEKAAKPGDKDYPDRKQWDKLSKKANVEKTAARIDKFLRSLPVGEKLINTFADQTRKIHGVHPGLFYRDITPEKAVEQLRVMRKFIPNKESLIPYGSADYKNAWRDIKNNNLVHLEHGTDRVAAENIKKYGPANLPIKDPQLTEDMRNLRRGYRRERPLDMPGGLEMLYDKNSLFANPQGTHRTLDYARGAHGSSGVDPSALRFSLPASMVHNEPFTEYRIGRELFNRFARNKRVEPISEALMVPKIPQVPGNPNIKAGNYLIKAAVAAWQRSEGKNPEGGLNAKGRASYKKETGGTLKAPVTESEPKGERAKRQNSFCSRMCGMKRKNTGSKGQSDPDSRINKSLRKWNCKCGEAHGSLYEKVACLVKEAKGRCWEGYEPVPGKEPYSEDSCRPRGEKKKAIKKEAAADHPLVSSNIKAVGHDRKEKVLEVAFHNGGEYRYNDVPRKLYARLIKAKSPGKFLNKYIKKNSKFEYERLNKENK